MAREKPDAQWLAFSSEQHIRLDRSVVEDCDFESWEGYVELLEAKDYPGLVRYCSQEVERHPDDLYAQLVHSFRQTSHSPKNGYGSPASTSLCTRLEYFNTSVSRARQCGV